MASLSMERELYATHSYSGEVELQRPESSTKVYDEVNVRVTGPPGVVRRFRWRRTGRTSTWCRHRAAIFR